MRRIDNMNKTYETIKKAGCIETGQFKLDSGYCCDFKFNKEPIFVNSNTMLQVCELLSEAISCSGVNLNNIDVVVGPLLGGEINPILQIATNLGKLHNYVETLNDTTRCLRDSFNIPGRNVLVVEIVSDAKDKIQQTIDAVNLYEATVVAVAIAINISGEKLDFGVPTICNCNLNFAIYKPEDDFKEKI